MSNITQDQAKVQVILTNLKMKVLVTKCVLVAFFLLLVFMILLFTCIASTWPDKAVVGFVEGVLGYTMVPLVKHYLPAVLAARK